MSSANHYRNAKFFGWVNIIYHIGINKSIDVVVPNESFNQLIGFLHDKKLISIAFRKFSIEADLISHFFKNV